MNRAWPTLLLALCAHAPSAHTGDAATGREIFVNRTAGHCVLCHRVTSLDVPFQGDLGPDLSTIGERLTATEIRYRIEDVSRVNPATIMPPYYRTESLNQVADAYRGKTVLTRVEIDHLVAYLASLKAHRP